MNAEGWWPDWRGATVVVAASGPSQRREDLELACSLAPVMAINNTWQIAPAAAALYACDNSWWACDEPGYGRHAIREFRGLLVTGSSHTEEPHHLAIKRVSEAVYGFNLGGGGNSAFQAISIAALWGAKRILLTGVDCQHPGQHHHGKHTPPFNKTRPRTIEGWITAFDTVAPLLAARGVEVINCTRATALECFPLMSLEDAL